MDCIKKLILFIPKNNCIVQIRDGMQFYHPRFFYKSPFEERIVPLSVSDIINSQNLIEIYGNWSSYLNNEGYIVVKNYPIKHVSVTGRIIGMHLKENSLDLKKLDNNFHDATNGADCNYDDPLYFIELCDCSGSILTCVLKEHQLTLAGLSTSVNRNIRTLIRLIGVVKFTYSVDILKPIKKLLVISATILLRPTDTSMVEEIKSWRNCLKFKNEELSNIWEIQSLPELSENHIDIDTDTCLDSHRNVIFHKNANSVHPNVLDDFNFSMLDPNSKNDVDKMNF